MKRASIRDLHIRTSELVREAHGKVTNFKDEPLDIYTEQVLATNGLVHDSMLKILQ